MGWRDDVEAGHCGPGAETMMNRCDDVRAEQEQQTGPPRRRMSGVYLNTPTSGEAHMTGHAFKDFKVGQRVQLPGGMTTYDEVYRAGPPTSPMEMHTTCYPPGSVGRVTMTCRDGISRRFRIRVKFDDIDGEPMCDPFDLDILDPIKPGLAKVKDDDAR